MKDLASYHPIAIAVYYAITVGIAMFCFHPLFSVLSLCGALLFRTVCFGSYRFGAFFGGILLFLITALINPLVSHNGATILFLLNDAPITLEALLYGLQSAAAIFGVLIWFDTFTKLMTDDKLLCLFGALSPKLALILSMGLRYVPLLHRQTKKIAQTQTALGLYREDTLIDRIRGNTRVFSVLVTWALENGIITADSMAARAYGIGRRSYLSRFSFKKSDAFFILLSLFLALPTAIALAVGALDFSLYPTVTYSAPTLLSGLAVPTYILLILLPTVIETEEKIKWNCLRSSI